MRLLAIDPGPTKSAWIEFDDGHPAAWRKEENEALLSYVHFHSAHALAIEMVQSFGMAVGEEVFETVLWTGRFVQAWTENGNPEATRVYRKDVKLHLCGSTRAKDANIRQALIDRYGGKDAAIGNKAKPGPLYGIKADLWSALAIGVTWLDTHGTSGRYGVIE